MQIVECGAHKFAVWRKRVCDQKLYSVICGHSIRTPDVVAAGKADMVRAVCGSSGDLIRRCRRKSFDQGNGVGVLAFTICKRVGPKPHRSHFAPTLSIRLMEPICEWPVVCKEVLVEDRISSGAPKFCGGPQTFIAAVVIAVFPGTHIRRVFESYVGIFLRPSPRILRGRKTLIGKRPVELRVYPRRDRCNRRQVSRRTSALKRCAAGANHLAGQLVVFRYEEAGKLRTGLFVPSAAVPVLHA